MRRDLPRRRTAHHHGVRRRAARRGRRKRRYGTDRLGHAARAGHVRRFGQREALRLRGGRHRFLRPDRRDQLPRLLDRRSARRREHHRSAPADADVDRRAGEAVHAGARLAVHLRGPDHECRRRGHVSGRHGVHPGFRLRHGRLLPGGVHRFQRGGRRLGQEHRRPALRLGHGLDQRRLRAGHLAGHGRSADAAGHPAGTARAARRLHDLRPAEPGHRLPGEREQPARLHHRGRHRGPERLLHLHRGPARRPPLRCRAAPALGLRHPVRRHQHGPRHGRQWATELDVYNRYNAGSGQGWAGAANVLWNTTSDYYSVQSPPTSYNWAFGVHGAVENPLVPGYPGQIVSAGTSMQPASLYAAQLSRRK